MTIPVPAPETTDTDDLVVIQQRMNALIDPSSLVDGVLADLDRLYQGGSDPALLDNIEGTTRELLEHARQLHATMTATVEMAHTLRTQREEARQSLDELKDAISTIDTSVPEIEELHEAIEEMMMEWMWDVVYEQIYDQITANSPLEWTEAVELVDALTGDGPAEDSPLWLEVREWLAAVRAETRA